MKRRLASTVLTTLLVSASFGFEVGKANFTGTWVMDKSRSEGLPSNAEQTMTITQTDDQLILENQIQTAGGNISIYDTFTINGKELEVTEKRSDEELKGKRVSKWLADGNGFESNEELAAVGGDGLPVIQQITRKWLMAVDGKTFTVESNITLPSGIQHTKRTFLKK
jgi:hypothetical protein